MALILRPPGSHEALQDRLADLGRTRQRFALATGLFTFVAAVAGAAGVEGVLDAALHLPPLVRAFSLLFILSLGGILWLRGVVRAANLRTDPLSVALNLEEQYPSLNDALASAVTFLADDAEERCDSNRLRKVAVRSAQRLVDRHEFARIIPSGACWRAGWLCFIVIAALVPLVLVNISRTAIAVVRLADPFGAHPWPTKTVVVILSPETLPARVPKGEPFALTFVVRGIIPENATVTFRLVGGGEFTEQYAPTAALGATSPATVAAQVDPGRLPGPFSFRIAANDYDTGWQSVDVVPPPKLVESNGRPSPQIHYVPPAYTGLPASDTPDAAAVLEAPTGTSIHLRGAVDRPLAAARLAFIGDKSAVEKAWPTSALGHLNPLAAVAALPLAQSVADDIPLSLSGDGRTLSAAFTPAMSGTYALLMTDETGLTGSRLLEFRLLPDPSPIVALHRPAPGRDPTVYTPGSAIPFHVEADDKVYALRSSFLEYRVGADGPIRKVALSDVRDAVRALPAVTGGAGMALRVRPTSFEAIRTIPVSAFTRDDGSPVRDGDIIFITAAADDWDDVTLLKSPGRSGEIEIRIASAEAVEAWVQRELAAMRPDLLRLRDQQHEARSQTAEAIPLPDGSLTPADRDRLLTAEQQQRQIRGKVSDPRDGLRAKAEVLRETLRANRLPPSNTTRRVDAVAEELGRIADRDLGPIEASLGDARQIGGQPIRRGQEHVVPEHLQKASRHQKAVEEGLTSLLDQLAVWGGAAEIRGEARVLRDQVGRAVGDLDKLGQKIPAGKKAEALGPAEKADLEKAAGKADLAAEQAGSILARAERLASEKNKQATELVAAAEAVGKQATAARTRANALPANSPEKSQQMARADELQMQADDLKATADKATAETGALRAASAAAGGQALPDDLRSSAESLRNNRQSEAANAQRSAAGRLEKLAEALAEKVPESAPELRKKQKPLADDLNALSDAQEDLRKRAAAAAKISDPAKREAELKKLAADQDKLIDRGQELLQRLVRQGADEAARDTRAALDRMESAKDDLERGKSGTPSQDEAIDRLDTARDRIDAAANTPDEKLADEKRRKMADKVKALVERQRAAMAEADRIHGAIAANKKWERPLLASYADLEEREIVLAAEVRQLAQKEFAVLPVLARLLVEANAAMEAAAGKAKIRREDALDADPTAAFDAELEALNDRKVKRPMALATRRLEQLLEVLKEELPKNEAAPPKTDKKDPAVPGNPMPQAGGGGDADIVPPLAQLKALKALQTELNERTKEFDKIHPDRSKLTDEEAEELQELEQAQREIAALFEQMAQLFPQIGGP